LDVAQHQGLSGDHRALHRRQLDLARSSLLDPVPLEGENLCAAFVAACEKFNTLPKLLGVTTTDNASNIDTLLNCFESTCGRDIFDKKEQHVRCVAHVVNLAVQALLRELKIEAPDGAGLCSDEDESKDGDDGNDGPDTLSILSVFVHRQAPWSCGQDSPLSPVPVVQS